PTLSPCLSDVLALTVALGAVRMARSARTGATPMGFQRAEISGTLVNTGDAGHLLLITIIMEAIHKLFELEPVTQPTVDYWAAEDQRSTTARRSGCCLPSRRRAVQLAAVSRRGRQILLPRLTRGVQTAGAAENGVWPRAAAACACQRRWSAGGEPNGHGLAVLTAGPSAADELTPRFCTSLGDTLALKCIIDGIIRIHDLHVWQLQSDCYIGTVHIRCRDLLAGPAFQLPVP
uniref:Ig-like domain-containing protein n=1 Tax=Macrostomum lignano TaxID=282301 RepID=A0A1I8FKW6_9PLAT